MSRKHFRVGLGGGRFVKLNPFKTRRSPENACVHPEPGGWRRMKQAKLLSSQVEGRLPRDDINVHITIYNVPGFLVKEFAEKVAKPYYTGGVGEAIKNLMWEAVQSQKIKHEASG